MSLFRFLFTFSLFTSVLSAQHPGIQKFSKAALEEDLNFIKSQLFNAHANPFTELDSLSYESLFKDAHAAIQDSMTAFELLKIVKPLFSYLSDEHANIGVAIAKTPLAEAAVFLPFTLKKNGAVYVVEQVLSPDAGIQVGDTLQAIEGQSVRDLIERCAAFTTGFPEQRREKAMAQLGLAYGLAYPNLNHYHLTLHQKESMVAGILFKNWQTYLSNQNKRNCKEVISLSRVGPIGYIDFCSFSVNSDSDFQQLESKMDAIFKEIKKNHLDTLIIDVSNNSGGNSACGNLIINYFYDKPYNGYQCNWKRSDEYLSLIKSWGSKNEYYEQQPVGRIIHFDSKATKPTRRLKNRFTGKVYVVVGPNTFSSAIMFATIVKDNKMAELIGQTPTNGHPNHFGEMYGSTTPNTALNLQFGVKEWIRPSGEKLENKLIPDQPGLFYSPTRGFWH